MEPFVLSMLVVALVSGPSSSTGKILQSKSLPIDLNLPLVVVDNSEDIPENVHFKAHDIMQSWQQTGILLLSFSTSCTEDRF